MSATQNKTVTACAATVSRPAAGSLGFLHFLARGARLARRRVCLRYRRRATASVTRPRHRPGVHPTVGHRCGQHRYRAVPMNDVPPLSDQELEELGKALFEEQERKLPEGQNWEALTMGDHDFWIMSAEAVVRQLRRLRRA